MNIPGKLTALADRNLIVSNGLQLYSCGAASLEAAMVTIIAALVEANERQQQAFIFQLQSGGPLRAGNCLVESIEFQ